MLIAGALPWLALLPGALRSGWTERQQSSGGVYLLSWVVIPLVFFSIAKGKLPTYILPCFAPLALLMADYAWRKVGENTRVFKVNAWINILFGAICVVALLVVLAPLGIKPSSALWRTSAGCTHYGRDRVCGLGCRGAFSLKSPQRNWLAAALCPFGAGALCRFGNSGKR